MNTTSPTKECINTKLTLPLDQLTTIDIISVANVRAHLTSNNIAWDIVNCKGVRYEVWLHEQDHSGTDWMIVSDMVS